MQFSLLLVIIDLINQLHIIIRKEMVIRKHLNRLSGLEFLLVWASPVLQLCSWCEHCAEKGKVVWMKLSLGR